MAEAAGPTEFHEVAGLTQLLVLPRGIEPQGMSSEGRVLHDSIYSGDTLDRAKWAGKFALSPHGDDLETVIAVGDQSYVTAPWRRVNGSEALAVGQEVYKLVSWDIDRGRNFSIAVLDRSRSVLGGLLEAEPVVDRNKPLGIVTHRSQDYANNVGWFVDMVMPDIETVLCYADNPVRYRSIDWQVENDQQLSKVYRVALQGVRPGNLAALRHREALISASMAVYTSAQAGKIAIANVLDRWRFRRSDWDY